MIELSEQERAWPPRVSLFPGGFGTVDELFELLTLPQIGKLPSMPVVLAGESYWRPA